MSDSENSAIKAAPVITDDNWYKITDEYPQGYPDDSYFDRNYEMNFDLFYYDATEDQKRGLLYPVLHFGETELSSPKWPAPEYNQRCLSNGTMERYDNLGWREVYEFNREKKRWEFSKRYPDAESWG